MRWKIMVRVEGGHVKCRCFVSPISVDNWSFCGDLTIRRGAEFISLMKRAPGISFVAESGGSLFDAAGIDDNAEAKKVEP